MSGSPSVTEGDAAVLHDHGHDAFSSGELQHPLERLPILDDIVVLEGNTVARIGLTGLRGVRSSGLSENQDFFLHRISPVWIT